MPQNKSHHQQNDHINHKERLKQEKQDRLAKALRDNLKKRKTQQKERAEINHDICPTHQ